MELEIRRVQKTGASTMTVSLPKGWIDSNSIKPGDPVAVKVQADGSISIEPNISKEKAENKKVIWTEVDESKEHLTRKLIGAYLAGYNIIEVRSKERLDLELKHAVKEISRTVIGPEVIEETSNVITLHDLSDPVELPQQKCVRRMHLLVQSMHHDAMNALRSSDASLAKDVIDRDQDVDRLYWMAAKQYNLILKDRQLSEKIGVNIFEGMALLLVARAIERIGDHAEKIANNAILAIESGVQFKDIDDMADLSASSVEILEGAMGAFFLKDIRKANLVIDEGEKLVQKCQKLRTAKLPSSLAAVTMTSVTDSITRVAMYATDIAEVAINEAMRSGD